MCPMADPAFSSPVIDPFSVHRALERMRQARSSGSNPLRRLAWIQAGLRRRRSTLSTIEVDLALTEKLLGLIEDNLVHHRRVEGLAEQTAMDRAGALAQLERDFRTSNTELKAWSLLYYRYVRLDLSLQIQDIAAVLRVDSRQIRRHLQHGYYRLTAAITRHEAEAQAADHHLWLMLKLPPQPFKYLVNRAEEQANLRQSLTNTGAPPVIVLTGPGGIGKTALAYSVVRQLIGEGQFTDLVWMALQESVSYTDLTALLAQYFGYFDLNDRTAQDIETTLRMHLYFHPSLITIDNADAVDDYGALIERLGGMVESGRLLLIARQQPVSLAHCQHMGLGPLSQADFEQLLYREAHGRRLSRTRLLDAQTIGQIYRVVGGNPLAGRLILGQLRVLPRERALANLGKLEADRDQYLFDTLFKQMWGALTQEAREVALTMALFSSDGVDWSDLNEVVKLPGEKLDSVLGDLVRASFIEPTGQEPVYAMPPLARRFLDAVCSQPPWKTIADLLKNRIAIQVGTRVFAIGEPPTLSILRGTAAAGLSTKTLIDLVETMAPVARRSGQWLLWRDTLMTVTERLRDEPVPAEQRGLVLRELGVAQHWLGQMEEAHTTLQEAVECFGSGGDFVRQAEVLLEAGRLYQTVGQTTLAYEAYQRAASVGQRFVETDIRLRALCGLASLALANRRLDEAALLLNEAANTHPPDAWTLDLLGRLYLEHGETQRAIHYLLDAMRSFEEMADLPNLARTHMRLGMAYHQAGERDQAVIQLRASFQLMRTMGDVLELARVLTNIGVVQADAKAHIEALRVWQDVLAVQELLNDRVGMAYTRYNLADMQWKLNQVEAARQSLGEARQLAEQLNLMSLLARIKGHPLNEADG